MPSIVTKIVGASFRGPDTLEFVKKLAKGTPLGLQPDPANQYDRNAVKVMCGDHWLGFIPRTDSALVAKVIREGLLESCMYLGSFDMKVVWTKPKAVEEQKQREEPIDPLTAKQVNDRLDMLRKKVKELTDA